MTWLGEGWSWRFGQHLWILCIGGGLFRSFLDTTKPILPYLSLLMANMNRQLSPCSSSLILNICEVGLGKQMEKQKLARGTPKAGYIWRDEVGWISLSSLLLPCSPFTFFRSEYMHCPSRLMEVSVVSLPSIEEVDGAKWYMMPQPST